jgi:hypothetical protein
LSLLLLLLSLEVPAISQSIIFFGDYSKAMIKGSVGKGKPLALLGALKGVGMQNGDVDDLDIGVDVDH